MKIWLRTRFQISGWGYASKWCHHYFRGLSQTLTRNPKNSLCKVKILISGQPRQNWTTKTTTYSDSGLKSILWKVWSIWEHGKSVSSSKTDSADELSDMMTTLLLVNSKKRHWTRSQWKSNWLWVKWGQYHSFVQLPDLSGSDHTCRSWLTQRSGHSILRHSLMWLQPWVAWCDMLVARLSRMRACSSRTHSLSLTRGWPPCPCDATMWCDLVVAPRYWCMNPDVPTIRADPALPALSSSRCVSTGAAGGRQHVRREPGGRRSLRHRLRQPLQHRR